MVELTAGYVAGLIAFGIVVARFWCPTVITLILAGQLQNRETAATWTVAGKSLQSSFWPMILQDDTAQSRGVRKSIFWTTTSIPWVAVLVSIAGIVTPLGLYERDEPSNHPTDATFRYVRDSSAFYSGTSLRRGLPFTRTCTYPGVVCNAPCPYTSDVEVYVDDGLTQNCTSKNTNTSVPDILVNIYSSGTKDRRTTISNYFDIGWRQLTTQYSRDLNNGTPFASGTFRLLESSALDGKVRPVEGLLIDATNGMVGFRNHTLPTGHGKGVTWSEDLLFLEPDVECVDTNTTLDFTISVGDIGTSTAAMQLRKIVITDRGGFVNINKTDPRDDQRNGANKPDLRMRAYQSAWYVNQATMLFMNITDPTSRSNQTRLFSRIDSNINKTFAVHEEDEFETNYRSLGLIDAFSDLIIDTQVSSDGQQLYNNPHGINSTHFDIGKNLCIGTADDAPIRLNNTYVGCNMIRGIPKRLDDGPEAIFEDGSEWSSHLYSCASAVKATIKTVTFFHNGTDQDLENLVVQKIEDKKYENDDEMPLWGVEDWFYNLAELNPIWGILDPAYKGFQNVSTIQAPSLYMVGSGSGASTLNIDVPLMNLPGSIVPIRAMQTVTEFASAMDQTAVPLDFTAENSLSLWLKWGRLSESADSVSTIIKLLWTDIASSALVGTKGVLGTGNNDPDDAATIQVLLTVHKVKYHWAFSVPALLVLLCMLLTLIFAIMSVATHRSSLKILDQRLRQVAVGRVLTTVFHPDTSDFTMPATAWSKNNGRTEVEMVDGYPKGMEDSESADRDSSTPPEMETRDVQSQGYHPLNPQEREFHNPPPEQIDRALSVSPMTVSERRY